MRRTPPPATSAASSAFVITQGNDSDTASERSDTSKVSLRAKRKREAIDCGELNDFKAELIESFASLSRTVEQRLGEVKLQFEEMQNSFQFMSNKYDNLLEKIQVLEQDKASDKKYITQLEDKVDLLERKMKAPGLEIRNVPKTSKPTHKYETKQDLSDVIKQIARKIGSEIKDSDIRDIYRGFSKSEAEKPIIVELNSVILKESILSQIKEFNKTKKFDEKLNTSHLNLVEPKRPIFVAETLTLKVQRLFFLARTFARDNEYAYCWTSKGQVYLRKAENLPFTRINRDEDLLKLKKST
jgi:hypothetical protein